MFKQHARAIITVLSLVFFFYMAPIVWGMLAKSQTDPETIEQAIDRIVSDHNDDTNAHIGGNRSLESHRTNDVLDHVPGSVYADKGSFKELIIETSFEDISTWGISGDVTISDFPGARINVEAGGSSATVLYSVTPYPNGFLDFDYSSMFQFSQYLESSGIGFNGWWGMWNSGTSPTDGYGFIILDGVLFPRVALSGWILDGATIGIDLNVPHVYRAQYDALTRQVDFYIDGDLVDSLVMTAGNSNSDGGASWGLSQNSSTDAYWKVWKAMYARSLVLP